MPGWRRAGRAIASARSGRPSWRKQFAISGLDGFLGGVYRWGWLAGLHLAGSDPLSGALLLVGLYAFVQALGTGDYGLVMIGGSLVLGVIGLIVANLVSVLVHEMAHALTVKHYGREVRRGGFMIYFGMPAFFVDTTDIWLEGKRARLAVTWAGPYSGLILAGLASIVLVVWPGFALNPLLFQFAILSYFTVFLNLNPLLELDGYYLLMDCLEIPMLRRRSLAFIRGGLWGKIKAMRPVQTSEVSVGTEQVRATGKVSVSGTASRTAKTSEALSAVRAGLASFSREEKIFTVYGALTAVWTAYAIYMGAYFWQERLVGALRDLWTQGGGVGKMVIALGTALLSLAFVLSMGLAFISMARGALAWAVRRGLLANTWLVAAILLLLAAVLVLTPGILGQPILAPAIGAAALTMAVYFAWRNGLDYGGSRLAATYWLLGASALALLVLEIGLLGTEWLATTLPLGPELVRLSPIVLGQAAFLALLLAGLLLFSDTNLKDLRPVEKLLMVLGILASYGLVLLLSVSRAGAGMPPADAMLPLSSSLVPLLVLTLLLPTLFSFWRTSFGAAWALLAAALAGLGAASLFGLPPLLAYLLLAGGLLLQHLAYRYTALLPERPQASLDLSDRRRLRRSFAWMTSAILTQLGHLAGDRAGRTVSERFNNYALVAGWRVSLVRGRVEDALPEDSSLMEAGQTYAAALNLLLDLVAGEVGEKLTRRMLQQAYDGLPWEEREIGIQYLFPDVARAGALDRQFEATSRDYLALLRRMPLLATMDEAELGLVCSRLQPEHHAAGKTIIRQGDSGHRFYIVERGHVEVSVRDDRGVTDVVDHLDRGDYFGELALLHDAPRNATCRAAVPTDLLSLSREDFYDLVRDCFDLREKLDRSITHAQLLRRMPLFSELDAQQIQRIAAQLQQERYEPGAAIIRQGEMGKTFYVIESGRVQVSVSRAGNGDGEPTGPERVVNERGPGEYVGEIALLLKVPRTATVRALTPVQVLALHKDDFDKLVADHLYTSRVLEQDASRRMMGLQRAA